MDYELLGKRIRDERLLLRLTIERQSLKVYLILIEVLGTIAEQERANIRQRQAGGIAAAKVKGVELGRPKAQKPDNREEVIAEWKAGKITARKAMELTGTTRCTFCKPAKE